MSFTSPLILLGLLPIALTAVWLMRRQGDETAVPFVQLWPADAPLAGSTRRLRRLPAWLMLLLLSAVSTIVSAAGPWWDVSWERPVHLVIDRGAAMSARELSGKPMFAETIEKLIADHALRVRVADITVVPPSEQLSRDVKSIAPSAVDSGRSLAATVDRLGRTSINPLVVVTNSDYRTDHSDIVVVPPPQREANAGIVQISATDERPTKLMVVAQSDVDQSAKLHVKCDEYVSTQPVEFKAGVSSTVIVEVPAAGEWIEVRVETAKDSLAADDFGWLVRRAGWPTVRASNNVPAPVAKFAEVYNELRPRVENAVALALLQDGERIEGPAAVFARAAEAITVDPSSIELLSEIAKEIDWRVALAGATVGDELQPALWRPLVRAGGRTILAESVSSPRRVLVNFWSDQFTTQPDFVVLLASIVDSFAVAGGEWSSEAMFWPPATWKLLTSPVGSYEPSPGIYRSDSGELRALRTGFTPQANTDAAGDWRSKLALLPVQPAGGIGLTRPTSIASIVLLLMGLGTRLTSFTSRPPAESNA